MLVVSALAKCSSVYVKVLYVMGKALTGELSCPVTGLVLLATYLVFKVNSDLQTCYKNKILPNKWK